MRISIGLSVVMLLALASTASAQSQIPPPTGPVIVCVTQAAPLGTSAKLSFDGAAQEDVVIAAQAKCDAPGETGVSLPAARFTVGKHTLRFFAINTFGTRDGPVYSVEVGIAPGQITVTRVLPPQE